MCVSQLKNIFNKISNSFNKITNTNEVILYGAGSLGEMAINILSDLGIKPKFIVDSSKDGFLEDIKIIRPDNIDIDDKENTLFLNCISTISRNEIESFLYSLGCKNIFHFYNYAYIKCPNLLSNGWFVSSLSNEDKKEIENVCKALSHDEYSLNHYIQFLWEKVRLKEIINNKFLVLSNKKYFYVPCIDSLSDNEILLDCGADIGQTIDNFIIKTNNKFKNIYAFEPNTNAFKVLEDKYKNDKRISISNKIIDSSIKQINFKENIGGGMASKVFEGSDNLKEAITIDSLNINPTIIKLHIEGNELKGLEGAINTIKRCKPKIMVLADHNHDGLYKIAKFLYSLDNYKLYFYLHDYVGNSAIFYAINDKGRI